MQFANPIWLWGLAGLLIPIGIHLLSRKEGKIIRIGSIRHLEDTNTKQFKSIRLNEIVLLAMRCLAITMLVLLISGFHFSETGKKGNWLLVEKGLEHDPKFTALMDSLQPTEFEIRSLSPGFPPLDDSIPGEEINYWVLVEDLKTTSLQQAMVLSYNYADGFRGERSALPEYVQWISKIPDLAEFPLQAIRLYDDTASLRLGVSNAHETNFSTHDVFITPQQRYFMHSKLDSIPVEFSDTISIAVVSDSAFEYDKKMMMTALDVLKKNSPHILEVFPTDKYPNGQKADWIIWLSERQLPYTNKYKTIGYKNSANFAHTDLFQPENKFVWVLTKRLNEEVALEENLTVKLAQILLPKKKYQARAQKFDRRVLPEEIMWDTKSTPTEQLKASIAITSSAKYITLLLLFIILTERLMAFNRRQ